MRSGGTLWVPTARIGGAGKATEAAGKSEIRKFWTALVTESWLLGTDKSAFLLWVVLESALCHFESLILWRTTGESLHFCSSR